MKKILLYLIITTFWMQAGTIGFSQNVTIDYFAWNPSSPPCDIFNNPTNVPATINGSSGTIVHHTQIGDSKYSTSDQSVQLDCNEVSLSDIRGTKYRVAYNFKVGYRYIITITAAAQINTQGFPTTPGLRTDLTLNGSGGGTACIGPQTINRNFSPPAVYVPETSFRDFQFSYASPLASAYPTLEIYSMPGQNGGFNSIRIRKVVITETPPACPINVTITGSYTTSLTQSQTWIKSSGQTTTSGTSIVKLDADPVNGYVELAANTSGDYFVASPSTAAGVFIAQAFDGCGPGSPSKSYDRIITDQHANDIVKSRDTIIRGGVRLYPNPASKYVMIVSEYDLRDCVIQLFDVFGNLIMSPGYHLQGNTKRINLETLKAGLYLLKITRDTKTETLKIVIQ